MPKTVIHSPYVVEPVNPHSQATMAGNHFYTATVALNQQGQVVGVGDIRAQTRQALQNLAHLLEAAGGSLDDVARVMIYLTDMRHFAGMNEVYAEFFHGDSLPSRATVTGSMGMPELMVEFDVIAYIER
ncbi:RidA family protein [Verticiella sediminum]|uniref:RidA family protein n=1 Tax=Verticiella sediminum TaxID=1247510 RepID=A0A556AKB0_9BURK|nr:RidA family protein [Verticiella sediminum]TSH93327.1 RidA family protein [Verticiella sediminum]